MKLKKYYNVDDYVLMKKGIFIDGYEFGKILSVYQDPDCYDVQFTDGWVTDVYGRNIERLLTTEEIEKYKAEKESKKYNL